MAYVWCNKERCRIPAFRCLLCEKDCYIQNDSRSGEVEAALEILLKSGKYKERLVMKRKEKSTANDLSTAGEKNQSSPGKSKEGTGEKLEDVFLLENGKLKPFRVEDYTASTLYQKVESFSVECKLVRPEEPAALLYEGKKPSKKTVPIILTKNDECVLLESWEDLESTPERLADADEVIGAVPVKQVFVLKRRDA
jgi:hypothetical protein